MTSQSRRKQYLDVAVFILVEMASLCILATGNQMEQFWLQQKFHNLTATIWGNTEWFRHYLNLDEENKRLAGENLLLVQEVAEMRGRSADFVNAWQPARENFIFQNARVVTMTLGSQHNYIIIDRGSLNGVKENDGLITPKGVLGIIKSVGRKYSYAISFANKNMTVSARLGRRGVVGSLTWDGHSNKEAVLDGIPVHFEVAMGDTVFTSGFSSVFPRDIPLGIVSEKKINNGSTATFRVELLEDFSKIQHIIVARNLDREEIEEMIQTGTEDEGR